MAEKKKSEGRFTTVTLSSIKMDLQRNPRTAGAYDVGKDKELKALIESIDTEGFRPEKPILLSDRGKDGLWVVQGHRRVTAAIDVNRRDSKKCIEIPAIVFTNLTLDDERKMLIDQFLVKKLNEYEQYLAVKQLLLVRDMSEEKIAAHVGMSRGWVQRRAWIAKFPPAVEAEWKKKVEGEEGYLPLTDKVMTTLKKAYEEDKDVGLESVEGGGPALKAVWDGFLRGEKAPPTPKAMSRQEILDKAAIVRDPIIVQTMKYCAGDPVNISDVQDELRVLIAKATSYDTLQRDVETGERKQA